MRYNAMETAAARLYEHLNRTVTDRLGREWRVKVIACGEQSAIGGWSPNPDRVSVAVNRLDYGSADFAIYSLNGRAHPDANTIDGLTAESLVDAVAANVADYDGGEFDAADRLCGHRAVAARLAA
jgi:hypothetical protein